MFGHLQFKTKTLTFNRDDRKTLFNHCLVHVISLEERVQKQMQKRYSNHNTCTHMQRNKRIPYGATLNTLPQKLESDGCNFPFYFTSKQCLLN